MNEKLRSKRDSLLLLSMKLGLHVDDIPFMYPDEVFDRKLTRQLAKQALQLKISEANAKRLDELCDIKYNRDSRTPVEYGVDLIFGWLAEDLMFEYLMNNRFKVRRTGVDRDREFLMSKQIKTDLDLEITTSHGTRSFDVYYDAQNYWQKNDKMDVRESKWKELGKENASIICISNAGFAIIDSSTEHTFAPNPLWGGKNCATIKGIKDKLVSPEEFLKELKEKIKER